VSNTTFQSTSDKCPEHEGLATTLELIAVFTGALAHSGLWN